MKALFWIIFTIFSLISLESYASDIDTAGLTIPEIQAIKDATIHQKLQLFECLENEKTTIVDDTSCINEVFGDVHN